VLTGRSLIACLTLTLGAAATPAAQTMWTKAYGGIADDGAASCWQADDGCFIAVGFTVSFGAGGEDMWLVKTDAWGDTVWTRTYGGTGEDYAYAVRQTVDGGWIVVGWTDSFGGGGYDVWLLKIDALGDTVWTRTYDAGANEIATYVQQTADGGYVIAAQTNATGAGGQDLWLIKTDAQGDTLWTRVLGGPGHDWPTYVVQTFDGGYVLTGRIESPIPRYIDVWLVKTDASGDTAWTRSYGGEGVDWGVSVEETADSGYVVGAWSSSFSGPPSFLADAWVLKIDAKGDTLWTGVYGGIGSDQACRVQQTADGGYMIVGVTDSYGAGGFDAWLIKTSALGDTLWTRTYGGTGTDVGGFGQQAADGGYFFAGYTDSRGAGGYDVLLVKTDTAGNTQWLSTLPGENDALVCPGLVQCFPNPCDGHLTIRYRVPRSSHVELAIHDVAGRRVRVLVSERLSPGARSVRWDAVRDDGLPLHSGVYVCRLTIGPQISTRRLTVVE
jgi:predicted secreted protein